jgi:hypothetical protein
MRPMPKNGILRNYPQDGTRIVHRESRRGLKKGRQR